MNNSSLSSVICCEAALTHLSIRNDSIIVSPSSETVTETAVLYMQLYSIIIIYNYYYYTEY